MDQSATAMPRTPILPLLLLVVMSAPTASAGWFDPEPVSITVAPTRLGQRALFSYDIDYREQMDDPSFTQTHTMQERGERLVLVESASRAVDAYGIERDTIARIVEESVDGSSTYQARQHCLLGTDEHVRTDLLSGATGGGGDGSARFSVAGLPVYSVDVEYASKTIAAFSTGPCEEAPNATEHHEGETLTLGALTGMLHAERGADVASAPAAATTFHGRHALRYVFDVADLEAASGSTRGSEGKVVYLLADGLPGVAHIGRAQTWSRGHFFSNTTLAGFEPGTGDIVAHEGQLLPERNPQAEFVDTRARLDDGPLQLSFPFDRALEIARLDPQGVGPWLSAHPDAVLQLAWFSAGSPGAGGTSEDSWVIIWVDGASWFSVHVDETSHIETPLGRLQLPARIPSPPMSGGESEVEDVGTGWPEGGILAGGEIARAASREGVAPGTIQTLLYSMWDGRVYLHLDQGGLSGESGRILSLDLTRGSVEYVADHESRREESGLLVLKPTSDALAGGERAATALSALAGPVGGLALPAVALTGLALVVVAAKLLLVPLFTRLRRDSLLDNPTRSRVFERVREHPGIHLAALAELVGLSESAIRHHVEKLTQHRYVVEIDVDGARRYYAAGELTPDDARRAALLRSAAALAVYELYAADPAASLREAARRLGTSAPSVHRTRARLVREGLLPALTDGGGAARGRG